MAVFLNERPITPMGAPGLDALSPDADLFGAGMASQLRVGNVDSRPRYMQEAYDDLFAAFEGTDLLGDLPNPWRTDTAIASRQVMEQAVWARIGELREQGAELPEGIPADRAELERGVRQEAIEAARLAEYYGQRASTGEAIQLFGGQLAGGVADPLNLASMALVIPTGGSGGVALMAFRTALTEAVINAGIELGSVGAVNQWRAELGLPEMSEVEAAAWGAAFGATFGGALSVAGSGVTRLVRGNARTQLTREIAREIANMPLDDAAFLANRISPELRDQAPLVDRAGLIMRNTDEADVDPSVAAARLSEAIDALSADNASAMSRGTGAPMLGARHMPAIRARMREGADELRAAGVDLETAAQANRLLDLGDDALAMVVNEAVPADQGAIVARRTSDPDEQLRVMTALAQRSPQTREAVEEVIEEALAAAASDDPAMAAARLANERARVLEGALDELDAHFAAAQEAPDGQVREQAVGDARAAIEREALRPGTLSDALTAQAQRFADTGRLPEATQAFARIAQQQWDAGTIKPASVTPAGRGPLPGPTRASLFDDPSGRGAADQLADLARLVLDDDAMADVAVPVGIRLSEDGAPIAETMTVRQMRDEFATLDRQTEAITTCGLGRAA